MSDERGARSGAALADLPVRRYPHSPLVERIWQLRRKLTARDAAYLALAEILDASLVTCDSPTGTGVGHDAGIRGRRRGLRPIGSGRGARTDRGT